MAEKRIKTIVAKRAEPMSAPVKTERTKFAGVVTLIRCTECDAKLKSLLANCPTCGDRIKTPCADCGAYPVDCTCEPTE